MTVRVPARGAACTSERSTGGDKRLTTATTTVAKRCVRSPLGTAYCCLTYSKYFNLSLLMSTLRWASRWHRATCARGCELVESIVATINGHAGVSFASDTGLGDEAWRVCTKNASGMCANVRSVRRGCLPHRFRRHSLWRLTIIRRLKIVHVHGLAKAR